MVKGPETTNRIDINQLEGSHISTLRSSEDMANEHADNGFKLDAQRVRIEVIERMSKDEGVISDKEKEEWKKKLGDAQEDMSRLQSVKSEFEDHWRRSEEMRKRFDKTVHSADEEGMLKKGEHDELDQAFIESDLAEKERALKEIEKELSGRRKEINRFFKLEKAVQEKRSRELEGAGNYDKKLKALEEAEHENKHFNKYAKLFKGVKGIAKKTINEYLEWFLTLSDDEQHRAIKKVEKEDIQPRVEAWEIHQNLPKEHQNSAFENWGLTKRLQYLGQVERQLDRSYRDLLQEGKGVFADKSLKVFEREFNKTETDLKTRLHRKINFSTMLKKQIGMEKQLWTEFKKFSPEVQDMLHGEFKGSDFEERKKLLSGKATKIAGQYNKLLNRLNNKIDPHIADTVRDKFENAKTIEAKTKIMDEAEQFQKSKEQYFKKWQQHKDAFHSDESVYRKWYTENVRDLSTAKKKESELDGMIARREGVQAAIKNLPSHLQKRINEKTPLSNREKQIQKLEDVARHYETVIPFLLKNGSKAEEEGDLDGALNFYLQAHKLDPDSPELRTIVAHLKQQGAKPSIEGPSKADQDLTDELLKKVDNMPNISDEAADIAQQQILLNLAKKHKEHVGASGDTTKARAKASLKSLDNKDHDNAENLLAEHGDSHTVDETGVVRKKLEIKTNREQSKETTDKMGELFDLKVHKGEATQSGLSEVEFKSQDGRAVEHDTANRVLKQRTGNLAKERKKRFLTLAKNSGISRKQMKAIEAAYDRAHKTDERVGSEIERLAA